MYALKVRQFPNREIRSSLYQVQAKRFSYDETSETKIGNCEVVCSRSICQPETQGSSLLDIGSKLETPSPTSSVAKKPGWGTLPKNRPFSRYGRRQLLRAGGVFSSLPGGHQSVLFLTGTLPGSTDDAFRGIAEWSAFIIHALKAWVNKMVPEKMDFYVWEHQKRGALHLHYAVYCPDVETGERIISRFPKYWASLIRRVSLLSGIDLFDTGRGFSWSPEFAATKQYAQRVERDVSSYLSKYVSKGGKGDSGDADDSRYAPSRWYGVSRPLLQELREQTIEKVFYFIRAREAHNLFDNLRACIDVFSDRCHIYNCRVTGYPNLVSYGCDRGIEELCLRTELQTMTSTQTPKQSLKNSVWTTLFLSIVMKRYYLTPQKLEKQFSSQVATTAVLVNQSRSGSIAETMDLVHAIRWLLQYSYRDRMPPPTLSNDVKTLEKLYDRLLTLRVKRDIHPADNLTVLDEIDDESSDRHKVR